jgi:hypothetical protein
MAQTAVESIIVDLDNECKARGMFVNWDMYLAMEKEQMISAMIYTFNQQNTLPYGMEYLQKRDGMLEDCENYYKETYGE